ncbi:hypothetical protein PILCRDRAFT_802185 [Piloderma croceum F 1598]|uniref:Major facilitator superfamily (MFS) profile domain-containing protein n=1 Tax=Piloderma croceum (strain F 1598) TaxID=765440 RepID=A0A0C3F0Q4_PILCF|nr:hypothetical protein PILCRDRAFT_802185 [Piloderma croceum F 1598]
MTGFFRGSAVFQVISLFSWGRCLRYGCRRLDYDVRFYFVFRSGCGAFLLASFGFGVFSFRPESPIAVASSPHGSGGLLTRINTPVTEGLRHDREKGEVKNEPLGFDPYLVGWIGDDDPENPRNWSFAKRAFTTFSISFLAFSVYIGSAIYTPAIPGLMEAYDISLAKATVGLTLYILAYGVGPMFFSPLQELPILGRNPVYIGTLFIFVLFQLPIAIAKNFSTVLAFRFLTGFFGSPALATGGASLGDIWPMHQLAYVIGLWALGGVAGRLTVGIIQGGFPAQANGWRWPIYELIWISGFALVFLALFLPETYEPTILLRRAERLRKLTGNPNLRSQSEIDAASTTASDRLYEALVRPFILAAEPALLFSNTYLGFVYAVFYLWFEAFPLVFTDIYHFNLGESGLPFLGFIISGAIAYTAYCLYQKYYITPLYVKTGGAVPPEIRLEIGLMASIFIPTSILIFGFTSKTDIHWIAPVIGAALYLPGLFLIFQSILMYITMAYPSHAASVLAGNGLFRSAFACCFPQVYL